eukprot:12401659-Karenia_brevis.AAC.1
MKGLESGVDLHATKRCSQAGNLTITRQGYYVPLSLAQSGHRTGHTEQKLQKLILASFVARIRKIKSFYDGGVQRG